MRGGTGLYGQQNQQQQGHSRYLLVVAVFVVLGIVYWSTLGGDHPANTRKRGPSLLGEEEDRNCALEPPAKKKVFLTGGAGFIGSHTAEFLLRRGDDVIVVDEVNNYYDTSIKQENLALLKQISEEGTEGNNGDPVGSFKFFKSDICDKDFIHKIFKDEEDSGEPITHICHLAARAGVRPSIQDPYIYVHSNVEGTMVILEMARIFKVKNLVYASSSSVYGRNEKVPFAETDPVDNPVSPYAATKKATELMGSTYNYLYDIPMAALRFFTVYGPRGRPDMSPFIFLDSISRGKTINRYGDGSFSRDFTYIDDIVQGVIASLDRPCKKFEVFNLGNSQTVTLNEFIAVVEEVVGKKAVINPMPVQPGDVPRTFADLTKAKRVLDYTPHTSIKQGMKKTAEWYRKKYPSASSQK